MHTDENTHLQKLNDKKKKRNCEIGAFSVQHAAISVGSCI